MTTFKVFISSTRLDLLLFRQEVRDKLVKLQQVPLDMGDWGSNPADAVTVSEEYVRGCDIFIGIYAFRYGYTPAEGGASVTEQEYELARKLGKRCLCYVADESLRPAASDEGQPKLERLSQFKRRIDRELVRSTFSSAEDLREKVGDDVNKLLMGFPLGYVLGDVLERWRASEAVERANLLAELQNPTVLVASPLEDSWKTFLARPGWHEEIAQGLRALREAVSQLAEHGVESQPLSELARRAGEVDTNLEYAELAEKVSGLSTPEVEEALRKLIDEFNRLKAREPDERQQQKKHYAELIRMTFAVRNALRSLLDKASEKKYSRLLPVLGGLGAGRTHFVASLTGGEHLLPSGVSADYLLLPVERPSQGEELETLILKGVRDRTGMQWRSLQEFDDFLKGPPEAMGEAPGRKIKLVVVADDFQKWVARGRGADDHKDALIAFASRRTKLHSLHWLILLQDTSYAEVAGRDQAWFWQQFSFVPLQADAASRVGTWIVLDQLNYKDTTGLRLIRQGLQTRPGDYDAITKRASENDHTLREICCPLVGRIVVELLREMRSPAVIDLNFIEFVTEFWKQRRDALDSAPLGSDRERAAGLLELATRLLAASLLKRGTQPYVADVLGDMTEAGSKFGLRDEKVADTALQILKDGNLLKFEFVPEPLFGLSAARLGLQFETFWEWSMAQVLSASARGVATGADAEAALKELSGRLQAVSPPDVREGVLIFLLLLLDQRAKEASADEPLLRLLTLNALASKELPPAAVWFAGPKSGPALQQALAESALKHGYDGTGGHGLFAFMYFLADCRREVLDVPSRLKLLQPHFAAIHEHSLTDYYVFIVERLFRGAGDEEMFEAMTYFAGCEVLGVTQTLAESALSNCAPDGAGKLSFVLRYLRKNLAAIRADFKRRQKPPKQRRYFFWEWFVCVFCRLAVDRLGLDAYRKLKDSDWYAPQPPGLEYPVPLRMRKEANLALGYWYRHDAYRSGRERYLELVNRLAESPDPVERETAFFFIRHTERYEEDEAVVVGEVFRPALRKLFLDPHMNDIVENYFKSFKANLDDLAALDARRRRNPGRERYRRRRE
jgi:hypothetical protein